MTNKYCHIQPNLNPQQIFNNVSGLLFLEVSSEDAAKLAKDKELEDRYNIMILENGVSWTNVYLIF